MTMTSIMSAKMSFINCWKATGALVSPSGITNHLKIHSKFRRQSSIHVWVRAKRDGMHAEDQSWYRSVPFVVCLREEMSGNGYRYFLEIWLRPRKSNAKSKGNHLFSEWRGPGLHGETGKVGWNMCKVFINELTQSHKFLLRQGVR